MPNELPRLGAGVGVLVALALLAGCQSYEASPLDLGAHQAAWTERAPGDESVRAFVRELTRDEQTPEPFDPADGLSLGEGEIVALVYSPELRLARLRAGVSAATAEHAGRWDDPELSVDVLRLIESASSPWVITPGLAFTIPISGRLEAEKARADASLHAALSRVAEQEWGVRNELRRAWLEWSAARLRVERIELLLGEVESLVGSTAALADAGEMARTQATLFALERAGLARSLVRERGEAEHAEQRLRAIMGLSPDAPITPLPARSLSVVGGKPESDQFAWRNPTLVRLRHEYEVAERTLRREIRKQYPDLTIGPLYEADQGQSRIGFLGAVPIPVLNANAQGIAEAEAERALARAAFETEYERIAGHLAQARARHASLSDQLRQLEDEIVPLVDQQLDEAQRLLELGEGGLGAGLVLLESLTRAGQIEMDLIDTRLAESLAAVEVAGLIGPPMTQPNTDDATGHPDASPDEVSR